MIKKIFSILLVVFFLFTCVCYFFIKDNYGSMFINFLFLLPSFFATVSGFVVLNNFGLGSRRGYTFLLLTIGVMAWFFGDIGWFLGSFVFDFIVFPSFLDAIYLLGYPLLMIGLIYEVKSGKIEWTSKKIVISIISASVLGSLAFGFGLHNVLNHSYAFWESAINFLYCFGDGILAILVIFILMHSLEFKNGIFFWPWFFVFLAFLSNTIADVLYGLFFEFYEAGSYWHQMIDIFWIFAYLCLTWAFLQFSIGIMQIRERLEKKVQ